MKSSPSFFKPLIAHLKCKRPIDWPRIFERRNPLVVEIGFGLGESLVHQAIEDPQSNFVGIEQHWERITKALKRISRSDQELNIRILRLDATVAFERLFGPRSIDRVYCLFPCPWPKKKHIKYRLFSKKSLSLINNRLKAGGELDIVTDFYPYCQWIKEQSEGAGFSVHEKAVEPQFDTKYERKWTSQGQNEFFELKMIKERHASVAVKRDIRLKTFMIKDFDNEGFRFDDQHGEFSVVLKEHFFDPQKQKAYIHLLVAEESLTQNFWVTIEKAGNGWKVKKAVGQNFFPTPATARALEAVKEAAQRSTQALKD